MEVYVAVTKSPIGFVIGLRSHRAQGYLPRFGEGAAAEDRRALILPRNVHPVVKNSGPELPLINEVLERAAEGLNRQGAVGFINRAVFVAIPDAPLRQPAGFVGLAFTEKILCQ